MANMQAIQVLRPSGTDFSARTLWLAVFLLLLLPKINLIGVAGQSAGLRVDDFILSSIWAILFFKLTLYKRIELPLGYGYYRFAFYCLSSLIACYAVGYPINILYPIRMFEYATFIYLGWAFAKNFKIFPILKIYFFITLIVSVGQFFHVIGGFTVDGYMAVTSRVVGLAAGPWEVGTIIIFVYLLIVWSLPKSKFGSFALYTALTALIVFMTGSRAAFASFALALLVVIRQRYSVSRLLWLLPPAAALISVTFFLAGEQLVERSENLGNIDNLTYVLDLFNSTQRLGNFDYEQFEDVPDLDDTDRSWIIRSTHWVIALREYLGSPVSVIFGVGMGVFGPALDGGVLRILVETGIIGLILYGLFLRNLAGAIPFGRTLVAVLLINMLFIDIHLSYKSMAMLLTIAGYFQVKSRNIYV